MGSTAPLRSPAGRISYRVGKRALDIAVSLAALALGAPLVLLIGAVIRAKSKGPILFAQERLGLNSRRFTLYKFRTLPVAPCQVTDQRWGGEAQRADAFGRWLRRLGLDEWPQFWNVLRGEMSVVGPRPERPYFAQGFEQALECYPLRHLVHSGITGWAQVNGLTGDTEISRRLEYDLAYVREWSPLLDLKILLLTPLCVLRLRCRPESEVPAVEPRLGLPVQTSETRGGLREVGEHARSF